MGKGFKEIFCGSDGQLSSKRITGILAFIVSCVGFFMHSIDIEAFRAMLTFAATCLGISELGKFAPSRPTSVSKHEEL